jgi:hypothetical protein
MSGFTDLLYAADSVTKQLMERIERLERRYERYDANELQGKESVI